MAPQSGNQVEKSRALVAWTAGVPKNSMKTAEPLHMEKVRAAADDLIWSHSSVGPVGPVGHEGERPCSTVSVFGFRFPALNNTYCSEGTMAVGLHAVCDTSSCCCAARLLFVIRNWGSLPLLNIML